jgi:hypothetical protein
MAISFGILYEEGGLLSFAVMEQLLFYLILFYLNKFLDFCQEDLFQNSISFERKKAEFNSVIKTDAVAQYPAFFICRFLHLKIAKFLFQIKVKFENDPEKGVSKETF